MHQRVNRYRLNNTEAWIVTRPWYIDLLTYGVVLLWMAWTFATIQSVGASPTLIISALLVAIIALLVIYGQRLEYLRVGSWFELDLGTRAHEPDEEDEHERTDGGRRFR